MRRRACRALSILVDRLASRGIGVLSRGGLAGRSTVGSIMGTRWRVVHRLMGRNSMLGLLVLMLVRLARWAGLGRRMGHGRRRGREWWRADMWRL